MTEEELEKIRNRLAFGYHALEEKQCERDVRNLVREVTELRAYEESLWSPNEFLDNHEDELIQDTLRTTKMAHFFIDDQKSEMVPTMISWLSEKLIEQRLINIEKEEQWTKKN